METRAAGLVAGQANAKRLRRVLNPTLVFAHFGHFPEVVGRQRVHYINPFRNDTRPSMDVWFDFNINEWRIGDFAEDFQGSALDIILRFREDFSIADATELARILYVQQLVEGAPYEMQPVESTTEFRWPNPKHDDAVARRWHYHYSRSHPSLPPVGFLRTHFGIVIMPNEMVYTPYYDVNDEIVGYKTLSRSGGKRAGTGSRHCLYGTRRALRMFNDTSYPIILCEGESDTWVMEYLYGVDYVVVGFPGANVNIETVLGEFPGDTFSGRNIIMCFDGDAAGTSGRVEVANWLHRKGAHVSIIPMPNGRDIGDLQTDDIHELFINWQMPYGEQQRVIRVQNAYRRLGNTGTPGGELSNWAINIDTFLIGDDSEEFAIRGRLQPTGRKVTITSSEFRSAQKLIDWSQKHARQFYGTTQDAQKLGSYLLDQATLVPVGRITTRVGLHRGDFVWADGHLGANDWNYVPRPTGLSLRGDQTWVKPRSKAQALHTLRLLADLHDPQVVMPMLAWMAVAPLRPLFRQFPILHLSGTSGSGKTTLTQVIMTMFSGSSITSNLTTTTPFAISAHFMCSNAFPIWFDEYRPGARDDAKKSLDQLLRDTYTGQVSTKGAMNNNKAEVTEILTDSPVIVTGEDTLSEKSHVDRSIIINIPPEGKNELVLSELDFETPLAHAYLHWLYVNNLTLKVELPELDFDTEGLTNRQIVNFRVLQYGYHLLQGFALYLSTSTNQDGSEHRITDWVLPDRSWDLVLKSAIVASEENPILELLRWGYEYNQDAVVDLGPNLIGISPVEVMRLQNASNGPQLPIPFSRHSALTRWVEDNLNGEMRSVNHMGRSRKMIVVPRDELFD